MKLAFCLFNYFPFGGLQRDFLRIAKECVRRGHTVDVYTMEWVGEQEPQFSIHIIPVKGLQNHTRARHFTDQVKQILASQSYDWVVGFNKMSGLDIYYAADTCYQAKAKKKHGWWYRWMPRYRYWVNAEKAVFDISSVTQILLIAHQQKNEFQQLYKTPSERFHLLPPGIAKDRIAPSNADEIRQTMRGEWGILPDDFLLLMVGSGFKTKGLDRILIGLAALPETIKNKTRLFVIGIDHSESFIKQAQQLNIEKKVTFLGGRHDVSRFFLAADVLLHPAYNENTGTVLLEALVSGLPVLTTDVCGYAHFVQRAEAGIVLPSPFKQAQFNQALIDMLDAENHKKWRLNALNFSKTADIYSMPERVVDLLETNFLKGIHGFDDIMQLRGEVFRELENRRTQRILLKGKPYFIKQHFGVGWKEIIKNLWQGRLPILSAKNEWQAISLLHALGVDTLTLVAYGCRGKNPAALQSFLITEALPTTLSLEHYRPSFKLKLKLIKEVARITRTLHEHGINHRDLYLCHFLLGEEKLYLIDLHRAQIRKKIPLRWRVKDLAGLYFSSKNSGLTKRDLFRFMMLYRAKPLHDVLMHEANLWKKVKQRGEKLYRKHKATTAALKG